MDCYYRHIYDRPTGVMAVIRAARPSFRNKHDKVAFAVHATFLNSGYYLTAAGKDDGALTSSASTEEEVGIDRWNEMEGEYRFVYATDARNFEKKVQVKCIATENKLLVDALVPEGGTYPGLTAHIKLWIEGHAGFGSSFPGPEDPDPEYLPRPPPPYYRDPDPYYDFC